MAPEVLDLLSVEEFWRLPSSWPKSELVAGQVVELPPPGLRHGSIVARLARTLGEAVSDTGLGEVFADSGFILSMDPATVRAPDIAVVLSDRLPSPLPKAFFHGAPDLAVEVLSPDDTPSAMAAKVADYLRAGTQAVWVVDPDRRMLTVHTGAGAIRYGEDETVVGEPGLPGFRMKPSEILPGEILPATGT